MLMVKSGTTILSAMVPKHALSTLPCYSLYWQNFLTQTIQISFCSPGQFSDSLEFFYYFFKFNLNFNHTYDHGRRGDF